MTDNRAITLLVFGLFCYLLGFFVGKDATRDKHTTTITFDKSGHAYTCMPLEGEGK